MVRCLSRTNGHGMDPCSHSCARRRDGSLRRADSSRRQMDDSRNRPGEQRPWVHGHEAPYSQLRGRRKRLTQKGPTRRQIVVADRWKRIVMHSVLGCESPPPESLMCTNPRRGRMHALRTSPAMVAWLLGGVRRHGAREMLERRRPTGDEFGGPLGCERIRRFERRRSLRSWRFGVCDRWIARRAAAPRCEHGRIVGEHGYRG
jgi:hypothetical protein